MLFKLIRVNQFCFGRHNDVVFKSFIRSIGTNRYIDYYAVLGLKSDCTTEDIRESFTRLSKEHHPDTSKGKGDSVTFQRIVEAYRILSREDTRTKYDEVNYRKPKQPFNVQNDREYYADFKTYVEYADEARRVRDSVMREQERQHRVRNEFYSDPIYSDKPKGERVQDSLGKDKKKNKQELNKEKQQSKGEQADNEDANSFDNFLNNVDKAVNMSKLDIRKFALVILGIFIILPILGTISALIEKTTEIDHVKSSRTSDHETKINNAEKHTK